MQKKTGKRRTPRELPIVQWQGLDYFVDGRLNQFREVDNPHNFIDFDTMVGGQMCHELHVMKCPHCKLDELMYTEDDGNSLECSRCGTEFEKCGECQ